MRDVGFGAGDLGFTKLRFEVWEFGVWGSGCGVLGGVQGTGLGFGV
jgi:hypothetical protein